MAKIQVLVAFEFEDVEHGSAKENRIVEEITNECYRMRIAFDAQDCWVDDTRYIDEKEEA